MPHNVYGRVYHQSPHAAVHQPEVVHASPQHAAAPHVEEAHHEMGPVQITKRVVEEHLPHHEAAEHHGDIVRTKHVRRGLEGYAHPHHEVVEQVHHPVAQADELSDSILRQGEGQAEEQVAD